MDIRSLDTTGTATHVPAPTPMHVPTPTATHVPAPTAVMEHAKTADSSGHAQTEAGNADPNPEQLEQMVSDMQYQLDSMNISLRYSLYGENNQNIAVKVINKETGEVIREIPPKEMQALQSKMSELVGMIFNDKG